ncbi:hypothetical protein B296_00028233 [Ensete ventricosum]|uniref:HTH myb-type domain-containing protein n=1 Tax=Ensete ventricosum TaxID=4639 RepID=A0A426XLP4_ENSVE|nr:hypothetical protein B296_00028233 [Ensete ventricosum]
MRGVLHVRIKLPISWTTSRHLFPPNNSEKRTEPQKDHYVVLVQTRKPYTITKQRERWTEEEHNRFLEALKLYGRAWQRIEGLWT